MHLPQQEFIEYVRSKYPAKFFNSKVLEVGSLNINGSIRQYFQNCNYIGIDVGHGIDVDIVCGGHHFDGASNSFDNILSCECFEHNPYWIETFTNMIRMTKVGGLVVMTCATTGRAEHGTIRSEPFGSPLTIQAGWDYYKNLTENDFREHFNIEDTFSSFEFKVLQQDLYFLGIKK